jgi:hypothetical protein
MQRKLRLIERRTIYVVLTGIPSRWELEQLHTENWVLLDYYAEGSGNSLPVFQTTYPSIP